MTIKAGGANDRMLFFTHASEPEWTVCATDHTVLENPFLKAVAPLDAQIGRIRKAKRRSLHVLALMILIVAGGVCGLFMLKEPLVAGIAESIPAKWEERLGDAAFSQLKAGTRFIEAPEVNAMLARITGPLLSHIPQERYPFEIHIAQDDTVNAFALPGGIIVLNAGLILEARSSEEIAGVLAHEAAHVTLRHGLRQMIGSAGIFLLVQAFFGDASGILAVMAENSAFLLTRKYSRDYERQADETGWRYLIDAGIDPRGMSAFFELLLKKQEESDAGKTLSALGDAFNFLSTHPTSRERIDHLSDMWKRSDHATDFISLNLNLAEFQQAVRKAGSR